MSGFRITGLKRAEFEHLFGLSDEELKKRNALRVVADSKPGFPCRISLADAEPGESLILVNYEHQDAASPYRSSHAVYVREGASEEVFENQIPPYLSLRLLSVRAFDDSGMMVDCDVVPGEALAPLVERMLADDRAAYLHVHNARPGCFAARVDRA